MGKATTLAYADCVRALLALSAILTAAGCGGGSPTAAASRAGSPAAFAAQAHRGRRRPGRPHHLRRGRHRPSGATSAAVERYDIARDRWRRVADMPVALNHAATSPTAAASMSRRLQHRSGLSAEVATLFRYDPGRDRWRRLPRPRPRAPPSAGVIGGRLYAAGGAADGNALTTLEVDRLQDPPLAPGPAMATAPSTAGAVEDGPFYALAGALGGKHFDVAEAYPRALAAGAPPADPQGPRRDRRRDRARRPDRDRRRRGVRGNDQGGRALRPSGSPWRPARPPTPRHGLGVVARGRRVFTIEGGESPDFASQTRSRSSRSAQAAQTMISGASRSRLAATSAASASAGTRLAKHAGWQCRRSRRCGPFDGAVADRAEVIARWPGRARRSRSRASGTSGSCR